MSTAKRITKKRAVVSYANMSEEVTTAFKEKYPKGYADYMGSIMKVDKPDGSFFFAVSVEVLDAIYLVKIALNIDDYDAAEKSLFGSRNDDGEGGSDSGSGSDSDSFNDDVSNTTDDEE